MMSLFADIADALENDWRAIARAEQLPPAGDWWSIWAYIAGRGAGKTRSGAEAIREWIETGCCGRVALIAPTQADARDVMIEGESGLLAISPNSNRPLYEPSRRRLIWQNGAIATAFSAEEAERLRGPQHDGLWGDEIAAWKNAQGVWDMAMFGLRLGKRPRAIVTTTPKPIPLLRAILKREGQDVVVTRGRTADNAVNLAPTFFSSIVSRYQGTRLGRQELEAEMLEDTPGALWSRDLIETARVERSAVPALRRIVVAIDPAISTGEGADETGIIVAGLGVNGEGYVLVDGSGKFSPIEWARRAVALYRQWGADRVVAEVNQGGAMVEQTLKTVDKNVSFRGVHASRGKITRAEPVAALAEQRRIHHVGTFAELEDQLCSFAGGGASPDRLDAMVWAFTDLMLGENNTGFIEFMRDEAEKMERAANPFAPPRPGEEVRLLAPVGVGSVQTWSGLNISVPDDRTITVSPVDAVPLRRAGFIAINEGL